ncbi:MAG: endonuclease MutS2, partial [Prevotella sp.]|nr:endonuclease MutS2 [Prevotella sp.]
MIYPENFEQKIGFNEIRNLLKESCLSAMGKELVDEMAFSNDIKTIRKQLEQVSEFRRLQEKSEDFPLQYFFDVRESVSRVRLEGTHMDEDELFDLKRSLETIHAIVAFLSQRKEREESDEAPEYPALHELTEDIATFPQLVQRIDQILDKFGRIKDSASAELTRIRREFRKVQGSVSQTLYQILRAAQSEGYVEKDATPALRDGRLVIPVAPGLKRRIKGIVHDESATGKTVFIEPSEVVEANNRIRELEGEERREIIRILKDFAKLVRPNVKEILESYHLLADIDFIRSKTELAKRLKASEPTVANRPHIDWRQAIHPLLRLSLEKQGKKVVPLDIVLTKEKRILLISGPNAGGKSVCLKTVGLLQYMLQCGLSIPVGDRSETGLFDNLMIDIGDEQSIENDLSTYSSHLTNMKNMMRHSNERTLLLIDEFGTGTEPQIGGAIAESVLKQFCRKGAWGIITTHYQNLKHFAEDHEGVVNGAMLYDRNEMQALFQLAIGRPGNSFAIEIARKTGIPEEVIRDASEIVGSEYIQSDKYLQDIVRDKRYWENKRQNIHQREKDMERTISRYENNLSEIEQARKEILRKAKEQAEELLRESNRRIENTIREIRESQAEKEETRRIREELKNFEQEVATTDTGIMSDDDFARKLKQIEQRKERKEKRRKEKAEHQQQVAEALKSAIQKQKEGIPLKIGDTVRIKGQAAVGRLEAIDGKKATAIFGGMRTKMRLERLEHADTPKKEETKVSSVSRMTRETIDERRQDFKQDIVRDKRYWEN